MTKHVRMIADVVLASDDHPTAEQIYNRIRENGGQISLATVYNNLKTLVDQGVLSKITLDGSPDRFDKPTHHDHLICTRCGRLSDVHLGDLTDTIQRRTGLRILSYDIRVSYLCEDCRRTENEQEP